QEMTRFGMKEPEMEEIARLMKECLIDGKEVREEVNRFRARFLDVRYSFDKPAGT
ncbi:MAG: serine hydroxymethyltransferase, partial [Planctomycetes bacterium]|nr:serine hydroxymethyltransferase [Planctomycetota bacterium]